LLRGSYRGPRFSPDGQWLAAWTSVSQQARIVIARVAGGAPHPIAEDFYYAASPVWSPDGARIVFAGYRHQGDTPDWWVGRPNGGSAVSTGAAAVLAGSPAQRLPADWLDDQVLFASGNLWRVRLSHDLKARTADRLTMSSAQESLPCAIRGPKGWRVVFVSSQGSLSLWSMPLDLNAGRPSENRSSCSRTRGNAVRLRFPLTVRG
jgi:hypothetical protein